MLRPVVTCECNESDSEPDTSYVVSNPSYRAFSALPEADHAVVALPEVQQGFLAMIQEALRNGPRGAQYDTRLMVTEWDFDPHDIQIPVFLWNGEADQNAPIKMGRYMANAIPQSKAKFYPNDGHLSLFKRNVEEILRAFVDVN